MLPAIEAALAPFEPRPHWGKLFDDGAGGDPGRATRGCGDFAALVDRFDPDGTFRNDYLRRAVLGR